ncbi:MAG: hypothetical protein ABJB74_23125 [Gemmatimonas sp.]
MIIQNRKRLLITSVLAVVLSIASSAALASAMSYDGDGEDAEMKTAACNFISCPDGSRLCGSAGGAIKIGIPPFVGEVNVTYTCYEPIPVF